MVASLLHAMGNSIGKEGSDGVMQIGRHNSCDMRLWT